MKSQDRFFKIAQNIEAAKRLLKAFNPLHMGPVNLLLDASIQEARFAAEMAATYEERGTHVPDVFRGSLDDEDIQF